VQRNIFLRSHYLRPSALLELSTALYEAAPPMFLITVSGASFDYGEGLSPVLQRALPEVVRLVRRVWSTAEDPDQPGGSTGDP
jgi:Ni,Fe-hydrogenase maturation factor